jgi:LysR family transcriptional regulator, transcriptional activator of nhaA
MINYKHLHYFLTVAKTGAINRAADKLHLTPQTLSGQIKIFEDRLGVELFKRSGRRLELTHAGKLALSYADEIFQIGAELQEALGVSGGARLMPFRVGISDAVPKAIAHQLLMPAFRLEEPVKLICREDRLERLVAELSIHRLDMVLADKPMPSNIDVRGFSHPLGECGVAFFARRELTGKMRGSFPGCLDGMPFLIPGEDSALRVPTIRWLERKGVNPYVVGEFDDSALMKSFGQAGAGAFPAPAVIAEDVTSRYQVQLLGQTEEIRERFFAITVERHVRHPAVLAVSEAAHTALFKKKPAKTEAGS